jgi:hypothetical protein
MTRSTGDEWIDDLRIEPGGDDCAAHRSEVGDARHTGEVLHQHARRTIRDLFGRRRRNGPVAERFDVFLAHGVAVFESQQILEQDLQRHRQPAHRTDAGLFRGREAEVVELLLAYR